MLLKALKFVQYFTLTKFLGFEVIKETHRIKSKQFGLSCFSYTRQLNNDFIDFNTYFMISGVESNFRQNGGF